uniref:Uncharacterized protein n=1 Tax=Glossina morsitans morsitans TaxID=37546 RepID=A0A1B0FA97_GLOMM
MNSERNVDPYVEGYYVGHTQSVTQVRFGPDGSAIATNSADSTVVLWDLKSAIHCLRFSGHAKRVNGISWSPKSNFIASCSQDGFVNIWEPKAHCICQEFLFHDKPLHSVDLHLTGPSMRVRLMSDRSERFGATVAVALSCCRVNVFDLVAQELVQLYQVYSEPANDLAFYPSGKFYAHWK